MVLERRKWIEDYINKYGPLSTTIQQRLRSVFGFGDIVLSAGEGAINVKVERNNKYHIPCDYFSESQIQILILSLFLSAGLTQTWSAFSPIILDDPVTHFDDMNSYSFIDLLRGIVNNLENKPQFLISLSNERLFRLMMEKLKNINGKAIFYEFKSIGKTGHVFKQV